MTAQFTERLLLEGEAVAMCTEPLSSYFSLKGITSPFKYTSTALWRGYQGVWEIRQDRLYLLELDGEDAQGTQLSLGDIFPGYPDRVFAHWYSGTLRIPRGKQLKYVHMGYGSVYEEDLLIKIRRGMLVGRDVQHNGVSDDPSAPDGYRVSAITVLAKTKRQESEP